MHTTITIDRDDLAETVRYTNHTRGTRSLWLTREHHEHGWITYNATSPDDLIALADLALAAATQWRHEQLTAEPSPADRAMPGSDPVTDAAHRITMSGLK
jgi:hypothetical protein